AWLATVELPARKLPAPLRVAFDADEGVKNPSPVSVYTLHSGALIVGTLTQDPFRHISDPRIIKPKTAPWYWLLHYDYNPDGYGAVFGCGETKGHVLAAAVYAWNRWVESANLYDETSPRPV